MKKLITVICMFTMIIYMSFSFCRATAMDDIEDYTESRATRVVPSGDKKNVYEVNNGAQLLWISNLVNEGDDFSNKVIVLKNDINLSAESISTSSFHKKKCWTPIGNYSSSKKNNAFRGEFDGNNKRIHGLCVEKEKENNIGLFGYIGVNAYIHDVKISDDCKFFGKNNVGAIVGCSMGGKVFNCNNNADVKGSNNVGGIVGCNYGSIVECGNKGNIISDNNNAGGVAGKNTNGRITDSYNKGQTKGAINVAGIAGISDGTIDNCYNSGEIIGEYYVGGVTGVNDGVISDCYNKREISGCCYVGGVTGRNNSTINISYNTAKIASDRYSGGISGVTSGELENCFNKGIIMADHFSGGITGVNIDGIIGNCYNSGDIFGDYFVGGLIGKNEAKIINCYNRARVEADYYVGAVIGKNTGCVRDVYWNSDKCNYEGIYSDNGDTKDILAYTSADMKKESFKNLLNKNCQDYNLEQPRVVARYWFRVDLESYPVI